MANPHPVLTPVQEAWLAVIRQEADHATHASERLAAAVQYGYRIHFLSLRQMAEAMGCSTKPVIRLRDMFVPLVVQLDLLDMHSKDAERVTVI